MTRHQHPHDHDERGAPERDARARGAPSSAEDGRSPQTEPVEPIPAGMSLDDEPALPLASLLAVGGSDARSAPRLAALAARIDAAAAPELERRAAARDVRVLPLRAPVSRPAAAGAGDDALAFLARALRPSLFAAAAALLLAIALGRRDSTSTASGAGEPLPSQLVAEATAAQALSVDPQDAVWIAERQLPSDDELVRAIALGGGR